MPESSILRRNFINSCQLFPDRPAFYIEGEFYSYKETLCLALAIFDRLKNSYQGESPYIGIYFQQNIESYAALLAISMTGGAYLPLNPKFPVDRNLKILAKAAPSLLLYTEGLPNELAATDLHCIDLSNLPSKSSDEIPQPFIDQKNAYLLFTSGTTGDPKGVPIGQDNVDQFLNFFLKNDTYQFDENDRFLQVYELTFDVSVFSIFVPLSVGACCYVLPQRGIRYLSILKMLREYHITVVSLASTTLHFLKRFMEEIRLPALRYSLLTADALHQELAEGWSKVAHNARIENLYGPTEATIWCSRYVWEAEQSKSETLNGIVSIGKVLPGIDYLLVDEDLEVVPQGEAGELCVNGTQVIPNYLDKEKPTAFFTKTIKGKQQQFYRTGDLVNENAAGNLLFRGRADNQVKINAYRIELGEVEEAFRSVTGCFSAVVCHQPKGKPKELYAFIQAKTVDKSALQKKLSHKLPDYMVPRHIFALDPLPVSLNGKLDRKHLISLLAE